jgi:TonB family protein
MAFCIASAAIWAGCRSGQNADGLAATSPVTDRSREGATTSYGPCKYRENAFRAGVDPPRTVSRVEPDLSGLPSREGATDAVVEVRISERGQVTEDCVLRGIRADVDTRVLAAVRQWQFDPPRLKFEATVAGTRLPVGTAGPIFMTVSVKVGT